jgi:hypothetical protein
MGIWVVLQEPGQRSEMREDRLLRMKLIKFSGWIAKDYDCVFPFGKYKYFTIKEVININPSYIIWLKEKDIVVFSDEIIRNAEKQEKKSRKLILHFYNSFSRWDEPDWFDFLDEPH